MLFLNKNSNKKEYFIQKIQITPKWLEIGIHKNEVFDIFLIINFEKLQWAYET
jgi:hypothetical protein